MKLQFKTALDSSPNAKYVLRRGTGLATNQAAHYLVTTQHMKIISTFLLLFMVVVSGCGKRQTTQIPDVTKPTTLTLTPAPGQGVLVHGISVRIRGKIDGSADIMGTELGTNHVGRSFEIRQNGDYYATNYVIEYVPTRVSTGKITIQYEFRCAN